MLYSLRFYLESSVKNIELEKIFQIFEVLGSILQIHYKKYELYYFEHDKCDDGLHKAYGSAPKERSKYAQMVTQIMRQIDPDDALFLCAASDYDVNKHTAQCELRFCNPSISVLRIDLPKDSHTEMNFTVYENIISEVTRLGFMINNSFCHYAYGTYGGVAFDGGQIGSFTTLRHRRIMKRSVQHHMYGFRDHLADIYWGNSIRASILSAEDKLRIRDVLGEKLIQETSGNYIFALSSHCSPYGIISHHRYRTIRSILKQYIV